MVNFVSAYISDSVQAMQPGAKQGMIFGQAHEVRYRSDSKEPLPVLCSFDQRGFTLVELVTVIILVGILAVVAIPRFSGRTAFDSRAFSDQVKASLRLAQKLAIAQHRNVCVNIAVPTSLSIKVSSTSAGTCDTPLPSLSGNGNYQITAPGGATLTQPAANTTITFNALGSPGATTMTVQVSGESAITVEKETGYVH